MFKPTSAKTPSVLSSIFFALLFVSAPKVSRAADSDVCLSSGCYDLMTNVGLTAYLQALESKSPSAERDPDYSDLSPKKREKVREAEMSLVRFALTPPAGHLRYYYINTIQEIRRSLTLRTSDPFPQGADLIKIPYGILRDFFRPPYVKGKDPATARPQAATFRVDRDIESLDLRVGMLPALLPGTENSIVCEYDKKKNSHGANPGFTVNCGRDKVKVKFGEIRTEPFLSRIMWALGYHIDPSDYAPLLRVRFDRRMFTEFNTQPGLPSQVKIAKIPVFKARTVKRGVLLENFVDHGFLKDGARVSKELVIASLGNPNLEAKVDFIVLKGVQIQLDNPSVIKIGPWSYNEFDHADNEDMRAIVAAMAWLGNCDVRLDNNRFVLDLSAQEPEWKFMISDLGYGLGKATSRYGKFNTKENLPDFRRSVAKKKRLSRFRVIESNDAFERATRGEISRVVARMMRLSNAQIMDAFTASGFSHAQATEFLHELLRRRGELARAFPPTS